METIKVTKKCFHLWLVLISYFRDNINKFDTNQRKDFYDLYYICWIFPKDEKVILHVTNSFLVLNNLRTTIDSKEYYWELSEKEQDFDDGLKWAWMYNIVIKDLLRKESKSLRDYFYDKYSEEEIDWKLNWNDELFD
jgi:hypothetical protein